MSARRRKLTLNYDKEHDVMYVSLGAPKPSYCDDDIEGVLIRRSLESNRLSGVTIMDFSRKTKEQLKRIIPFNLDISELYR
ncbi:MAG TPA: hypothetical protein DCZ10_15860 [Pelotomaculum sp.]|nr:hypothetical protein [Pelotomaculum sp.]